MAQMGDCPHSTAARIGPKRRMKVLADCWAPGRCADTTAYRLGGNDYTSGPVRFFGAENAAAGATEGLKSLEACAPPSTALNFDTLDICSCAHSCGPACIVWARLAAVTASRDVAVARDGSAGLAAPPAAVCSHECLPGRPDAICGLVGDAAESRETAAASVCA